jgi:Fe-S cluster assembly protein SufD
VFYLLSRGIPRETAEHMMSLGFALEVVERLGQPAVEAMAVRLLAARLAEIGV